MGEGRRRMDRRTVRRPGGRTDGSADGQSPTDRREEGGRQSEALSVRLLSRDGRGFLGVLSVQCVPAESTPPKTKRLPPTAASPWRYRGDGAAPTAAAVRLVQATAAGSKRKRSPSAKPAIPVHDLWFGSGGQAFRATSLKRTCAAQHKSSRPRISLLSGLNPPKTKTCPSAEVMAWAKRTMGGGPFACSVRSIHESVFGSNRWISFRLPAGFIRFVVT